MIRTGPLIYLALLGAGAAPPAQAPEVRVAAVPEFAAVRPGGAFRVAVRLQIPQGWHIGWINPGAGGLATTIAWQAPPGVTAGGTEWPYPETADASGEISHVYRDTVVIFSSFDAPRSMEGPLTLSAEVVWGLCRVQCIQQNRTVSVSLRVAPGAPRMSAGWGDVALAQRAVPLRLAPDQVRVGVSGDSVTVNLPAPANGLAAGSWVTFFPFAPGGRSVVAQVHDLRGGVGLTLPIAVLTSASPARLAGVLVAAHPPGAPPAVRALAIDAQAVR